MSTKKITKQAKMSRDDLIGLAVFLAVVGGLTLYSVYFLASHFGEQEGRRLEIEQDCRRVIGTAVRTEDGVLCLKRDASHWLR